MYVDNSPGSLEVSCTDGTHTIPLGYSGTIQLNSGCKYKMIDGPINSRISLPPSISMEIIPRLKNSNTKLPGKTLIDDLSSIQVHFRKFGYIYWIVTGSVVLVLAMFASCLCYIRCQHRKGNNNRSVRRKRTRRAQAMDIGLEEMLPPPQPTPVVRWPSIKFLPNAISIRQV